MVSKLVRFSARVIGIVMVFVVGMLVNSNLYERSTASHVTHSSAVPDSVSASQAQTERTSSSLARAYNATHLWSMRLADENYYRIARQVPCRNVTYLGFRETTKNEPMDHCNEAIQKEYSIESTLQAQKWLYDHQNPADCNGKNFAIIHRYAWSGVGSTIHQILWAFASAVGQNRIAVYEAPGQWQYGNCDSSNPDCLFLPISHCPVPSVVDGTRTIRIAANIDHWYQPIYPSIFKNRPFNWYRSQLLFYLIRFNAKTLAHVQNAVARSFVPPSLDLQRPYISVYVRRSDKVRYKEMLRAYSLKEYFDLFDATARRAKISRVYINSEDDTVLGEFGALNKNYGGYYKLLRTNATKDVIFMLMTSMSAEQRGKVVLEFLTDLYIEANADLHAGTLTSNWCRLGDEIRLALGKIIPYYTPENRYIIDM